MVNTVVKMLVKSSIIAQEDFVVYQYGFNLLIRKILHIFMILLLGIMCRRFGSTVVFLIAYASIREYAGGYHAKTSIGCYFCTGIVTFFSILLFYMFEYIALPKVFVILSICAIIIGVLAPQETVNRPLEPEELIMYRKKAKKCLIIEGIICLISLFFRTIIHGILCAWIVEAFMLLIGRIDTRHNSFPHFF